MKIIRIWVDLLCSKCYAVLKEGLTTEQFEKEILFGDEPQMCQRCTDALGEEGLAWVFPIVVQKREDEEHTIEIVHIGGAGIKYSLPQEPQEGIQTGTSSKTIRWNGP